MFRASNRLLLLSNIGRRASQRSVRLNHVLSTHVLRPTSSCPRHIISREGRCNYVVLSGSRFDVANAKSSENDSSIKAAPEHGQEGHVEEDLGASQRNLRNREYRSTNVKFKNYSNSDYQDAASLRKEFNNVLEKQGGEITPVTSYQFIRNCGNKMVAEPAENRIILVTEIWDKLKDKGVKLETTHYNALLSVFIQNRHQFSPLEFLAEMQESKVQPDKSTYMLIVQAYCQEGDLSGALRVVDFMTKQDIPVSEPIYTSLVTGHCKNNDMEGANKVFETMRENNITPQVDSYTALIAGYASIGDLDGIQKVFAEMDEKGVATNTLLYMNMLDAFCRHGYSSLIPEGLKMIKHKAPVEMEMRYFIQRLITRGDYESAAILAKNNEAWLPAEMLNQDELKPHNLFVYRLFRANKSLDEMVSAMRVLESHGLTISPLEDVLDICHGQKSTDDAIKMLDILKENGRQIKPHYVYPMLVQLSEKDDFDGILRLLSYMTDNGIKVDATSFEFASKAFKKADSERAGDLMDFAREKGLRLSWKASSDSLDSILEGNSVEAFLDILPSIHIGMVGSKEKSDKVAQFLVRTFDSTETPKAIIALDQKNLYRLGWVLSKVLEPFNVDDQNRAKEAFQIFNTLVNAGAMKGFNNYCYTLLLNIFYKNSMKNEFFKVVDVMKEQGIEPNESQYFIMLKMSSLIGNSAAAQFCFDKLKATQEPTEAQYNALLISYGKDNGKGKSTDEPNTQYTKKIISLYEEMQEKGLRPLGLTVSQVLVSYASLGLLDKAEEVRRLHGLGVEHRKYAVYNEYLRLYSKQGKCEDAEKIFQEMKDSKTENLISLFSYNQLIGTHKMSGNIERVLELIEELQERGFTPNRITYSELVKCYLRRGEADKALQTVEGIMDNGLLPSTNVLFSLVGDFFERSEVENCERAVALIRRKSVDAWGEQRLNHILLMMYLKVDNLTAARNIIDNADFRLTQRLIMSSLGGTYKDMDFLYKARNFLRDNNLNYFLMDLSILNALIAKNDVDAALHLYNEKKENDAMMTNYFLQKLANFLSASGREVPFDTSNLSKTRERVQKEKQEPVAENISETSDDVNSNESEKDSETSGQDK